MGSAGGATAWRRRWTGGRACAALVAALLAACAAPAAEEDPLPEAPLPPPLFLVDNRSECVLGVPSLLGFAIERTTGRVRTTSEGAIELDPEATVLYRLTGALPGEPPSLVFDLFAVFPATFPAFARGRVLIRGPFPWHLEVSGGIAGLSLDARGSEVELQHFRSVTPIGEWF